MKQIVGANDAAIGLHGKQTTKKGGFVWCVWGEADQGII